MYYNRGGNRLFQAVKDTAKYVATQKKPPQSAGAEGKARGRAQPW